MNQSEDPQYGRTSEPGVSGLPPKFTDTERSATASGTPVNPPTEGQDTGVTDQITDSGREAADTVRQKVDERRSRAAEGVRGAADKMRSQADSLPGGQRTSEAANMAADKVENAATYISEHDVDEIASDLERMIRQNPKEALIVAAGAGFLVGWMLRR